MSSKLITLIISLCIFHFTGLAQSELQIQNIGELITISNDTIKECKVGYRTFGTLNNDKSNVVFMPTWHLGTSQDNLDYLISIIDTTDRYLIVVDALGNGVSSSPSNHKDFPEISIRDMVNSQHKLLINHLQIEHVELLIGVSMGGMQAFEWMVAFPDFMNKLIAINGTTKASFYDKVLWSTKVNLIENAGNDKYALDYAMNRISDIELLVGTSPKQVFRAYENEDFQAALSARYSRPINPFNKLTQSKAILEHNIYKNDEVSPGNIAEIVKSEIYIIIAELDQVVNPIYSRELSKILKCDILELKGDCGHIATFCDFELVRQAISDFLKK